MIIINRAPIICGPPPSTRNAADSQMSLIGSGNQPDVIPVLSCTAGLARDCGGRGYHTDKLDPREIQTKAEERQGKNGFASILVRQDAEGNEKHHP